MRKFLILILVVVNVIAQAQDQRLTGKVASAADRSGLPGVNVVIKGTSQGTITDIEGQFSMDVPSGATLQLSFIGYKSE